jgi:hypothetical protein
MQTSNPRSITSYIVAEDDADDDEALCLIIEGGLAYALRFAEAFGEAATEAGLQGIYVSAIRGENTSGLFFHDEINDQAVRITMNGRAGCGRMYMGTRLTDFGLRDMLPRDELEPFDWDDDELPDAVSRAVEFFLTKQGGRSSAS